MPCIDFDAGTSVRKSLGPCYLHSLLPRLGFLHLDQRRHPEALQILCFALRSVRVEAVWSCGGKLATNRREPFRCQQYSSGFGLHNLRICLYQCPQLEESMQLGCPCYILSMCRLQSPRTSLQTRIQTCSRRAQGRQGRLHLRLGAFHKSRHGNKNLESTSWNLTAPALLHIPWGKYNSCMISEHI